MPEDSDYYGSDTDETENTATATAPDQKGDDKADEKKMDDEGETALLPKSVFQGHIPEVGDVCHFKVEHIWENEIEVSWVADEEGEEGEGKYGKKEKSPMMDEAMGGFDKMVSGDES